MKRTVGHAVALALGVMLLAAGTLRSETPAIRENPDVVLRPATPTTIHAGSPSEFHRFELSTLQTKDRWIRAISFQPGDPRVVRSAFFYVDKTGQWLGGWVPGSEGAPFPDTVAAYLPAGAKLVLDIHYQS